MRKKLKKSRYPENLKLRGELAKNRISLTSLAEEMSVSRQVISLTVNGHYKGENIVPVIEEVLARKAAKK